MTKAEVIMNKVAKVLTTEAREHISKKNFAIPEKKTKDNPAGHGAYPIPNENHARAALSMVAKFGTPEEKKEVREKVHKKYPDIGDEEKKAGLEELTPLADDAIVLGAKLLKPKQKPVVPPTKLAEHFVDQNHPAKVKEIFEALKREHPEYSAKKKAMIANSTYDKMK